MPTRWLSLRKRNPLHQNDQDLQLPAKQQDFDFAFGEPLSPPRTDLPRVGPRLVQIRPTTSGGNTGKRKPRVEVPSDIRPRTTEAHKPSPLQNLDGISKSEDSLIGLAFGSPSHPPATFGSHVEAGGSPELNPFARHTQGLRDKASQMQSKRWRKIGTLFKPRHVLRRDEVPSGPTIGLPTGFVVLDKDPALESDHGWQDRLGIGQPEQPTRVPPPPPLGKDAKTAPRAADVPVRDSEDDGMSRPSSATATETGSIAGEPYSRPPLPKLELAIPRNLDAAKRSSSLLARRSKTLESLKSFEDSRRTTMGTMDGGLDDPSKPHTPLKPPRRLTTPTMTRSPAVSKYSLFPTTSPAPVKFVGRVPGAEHDTLSTGQLKRSLTSPARLSPMRDNFGDVSKPIPLNPRRIDTVEPYFSSPEDTTASTDHEAPWSSAHSFKSSVSSATTVDEIFFDIKSFRDSKGVEDGHFFMTRPDSAQVELARTRSKRAGPSSRLRQMEASMSDEGPSEPAPASTGSQSAWTTKHTSVNTAYFDEAIAAVERLTTPTGGVPSVGVQPPVPTVPVADLDDKLPLPLLSKLQPPKPADHHLRLTIKSHEEVSRLIPSPVVESKETDSPKSDASTIKGPKTQQTLAAKAVSPQIAAVKRVDRPIDDSPTIPQGPPSPRRTSKTPSALEDRPPPVPKKDAKFIPMSKYAPKGTVKAIERRSGVTPTRPVRANTEDLASRQPSQWVSKDRSATMPSSGQTQQPHQSPPSSSLRGLEKAVPPRPNPVALNPTGPAEVAIARTVSLSRKQSARVHIAGPRLAARRAEAQASAQTQTQARSQSSAQQHQRQPSAHRRNPSTVSQKSNKSPKAPKGSILGHRHNRTASSTKSIHRASKDLSKTKVVKTPAEGKSGSFGKSMWSKESEKQLIKEARKWEILEKKSYSPIVVPADLGHRPGLSVGLVVEGS
ncbi:hypothetical protein A1O7_05929 [Cladophialophora yegresii CBS 114405]|uniref:Uncharacterized protein n=1 Tax=Cladophialophora yegresii CBS 114405 TaxID=1182544 RepID=W9VSG7_9EURO|nr:uncharacterized protein A1O7_05929 [Cladophialophora yegresii CBS 114405]EXJ58503.1 hypothetical protein A1O7_05929 [Cladophialophora yegresii CBS 114405]